MNSIKQALSFLCILILLAGSSWYFGSSTVLEKLDEGTLSRTADMFVHNLKVHKFDADGILVHQLSAPSMQHYPQDDSYIFQKPFIIVNQKDQPAWNIRSEKAQSRHAAETITFTEQVVVHQNAGKTTQESTMTTEKIVYYPKEKKASSDALVTFEQPGNTLQSTGMTAWLAEKRVQLLHQARGKYVPKVG